MTPPLAAGPPRLPLGLPSPRRGGRPGRAIRRSVGIAKGRLREAVAISVLLHVLAAGTALEWPALFRRAVEPEMAADQGATVEVVMGGGAEAKGQATAQMMYPPPPVPPEPPSPSAPPVPSAPPAPQAPAAPPAPPMPPAPSSPPAPPAPSVPSAPPTPAAPSAPPAPAAPPAPPAPAFPFMAAEPAPEGDVSPASPPAAQLASAAPASAPSAAVPAAAAAAESPAPPKWQSAALLAGGDVGAAELVGERLRPAVGDQGNLPPVYPADSARFGEQGVVVVRMHIAPDGHVDTVELLQSSGYSRLDRAAQGALARWRFTPAVRNGVPVDSVQDLPVRFRLN
ncbi:Energy transducer TonB [Rhodovastum atsumiense]|uniref:Energy transducer TonB n=1 Tax=Rhodovastum atsumiense TaxID=504468 RepID=A0A5M6IJS2_9PROT|nr:energy transducer TonB [Rhodovastum atsumiense]KAA5608089.1 energy transducer TonB [Rhodovastum atsumiense]CAH2604906.1 Energy transducer TonB [Rhodovastum atsumiense]